ncbi:MAG: fumarylacetoacetase [Bacteroidia bacterium]|nr:fumarylacetoacetase [Bacteroidia bacterium]
MNPLTPWVEIPLGSDFSIYNIPFGIFSLPGRSARVGVAIGEQILDLSVAAQAGIFEGVIVDNSVFSRHTLNDFIRMGKKTTGAVRNRIQETLCDKSSPLKNQPHAFVRQSEAIQHLPVAVGDYTDFYSSIEHATNVGKMFRDPENALLPNWRHLPVGYHGRASSIVVSGTAIHRPSGQVKPKESAIPVFQPSTRLDFELEMAFIVGRDTSMGEAISTDAAEDYIFGMVLFNDWSARDIQQWEYVPLGPFLGKNFASSVSPWIVTLEALEPFRVNGPTQEPAVLPYLQFEENRNYDISLEVTLTPEGGIENTLCRSNFRYMYWNMVQQLAHHTVNGCNIRVGDMMASGTISGPTEDSFGSMLERAWMGTRPVRLNDGSLRTFIQNGDTVTMRGYAEKAGFRVGFGEVSGKVGE